MCSNFWIIRLSHAFTFIVLVVLDDFGVIPSSTFVFIILVNFLDCCVNDICYDLLFFNSF